MKTALIILANLFVFGGVALAGDVTPNGNSVSYASCSGDISSNCSQVTSGAHLSNNTVPNAALVSKIEIQVPAGNSSYGANTSYATGVAVLNETFSVPGTVEHLTIQNITGGTCSGNAPSFNVYKIHSAVETDGTAIAGSTTQQAKGTQTTQTENLAFAAGDQVGVFISAQGSGCNAPIYDVDILISEP